MHRVRTVQHALAARATEHAGQEVLDVTERCAIKVFPTRDAFQHLLTLDSLDIAQHHCAFWLHVAQPDIPVSAIRGSASFLLHIRQIAVFDESIEAHRTFWSNCSIVEWSNDFLGQLLRSTFGSALPDPLREFTALLDTLD